MSCKQTEHKQKQNVCTCHLKVFMETQTVGKTIALSSQGECRLRVQETRKYRETARLASNSEKYFIYIYPNISSTTGLFV